MLNPDYRFDIIRSQRGSIDEMVRARSLAARCIQVMVAEGVRRARVDSDCAAVTRASIKADLERAIKKDGVWGLIHLTLIDDRRRYYISCPSWQNSKATELLERQAPYLFEPMPI